jgi:hypothetical protein
MVAAANIADIGVSGCGLLGHDASISQSRAVLAEDGSVMDAMTSNLSRVESLWSTSITTFASSVG